MGLERAFHEELISLDRKSPNRKFRNLLGRYIEGVYQARGMPLPEQLGASKLRDRTTQIHYQHDAITFEIERHPQPVPVRQRWHFDLKDKGLTLIEEAPVYLSCEDAAKQLGVTAATVRRYIAQGKIQARRASDTPAVDDWFVDKLERGRLDICLRRILIVPPNKWLITPEEVERLMQER